MVCVMSLHGRLFIISNGGDVALGLLCIWTAFLPTGRRWSVDAVLARDRPPPAPAPEVFRVPDPTRSYAGLAVLVLTFQLAAIYFFNTIHKHGDTWLGGTAVHYALHLDRIITPIGLWFRGHLTKEMARILTYGALATEAVLPVLLLAPFAVRASRRLAILLVIGLHLGFAMFMNLGTFVPAMISYTPYLLRGEDWDALGRWWVRSPRRVRFIAHLDRRLSTLILRIAGWFRAPLPLARAMSPIRATIWRQGPKVRDGILVVFVVVATSKLVDENAAAKTFFKYEPPAPLAAAATYLNLFQGWTMFAPDAPTGDLNVHVDAVTVSGRHVDPYNEAANPKYPFPGKVVPVQMGPNWLFYDYVTRIPWYSNYWPALQQWILRYPDRTGRPEDRIVSFEVFQVLDDSPPPGEQEPRNRVAKLMFKYPP
jgi:hypothetical protein